MIVLCHPVSAWSRNPRGGFQVVTLDGPLLPIMIEGLQPPGPEAAQRLDTPPDNLGPRPVCGAPPRETARK